MLRLIVFALAICVPSNAQFAGLATPADGSRVYFATALRQKNTTQPVYGKLFTVDAAGLKLFLSRDVQIPPPPPGTNSVTPTNPYDLQAASVSADGKVFAASAMRGCVGNGECGRLERYFTTISAAGQDTEYPGNLQLGAGGAWAFGASGITAGDPGILYLVNVTTGQKTLISSIGGSQVASSGRTVADDGTAVYAAPSSLVVVHGSDTRHITAANHFGPRDAVIDRAGATIVFAVCANISTTPDVVIVDCGPGHQSLRLADPSGSGSSLLVADGFAPSLSDDGKTLLYLSTRTGSAQIRVANLNDGATLDRQLGFEAGGITRAILSGDGSTVYAVTANGRLQKTLVATRAVQELIPRTPYLAPDYLRQLATGKLVALAGGGLTDLSFTADPPLPETLNGISVTIQGVKARILSVAPEAITVLVPPDVTPSENLTITSPLETTVVSPSPFDAPRADVYIAPWAPEFVHDAEFFLIAAHQDWSALVTPDNPARPGEALHAYGVGFGPTSPAVPYGNAAPAQEPFARITVTFGCATSNNTSIIPVETFFQGLAPNLAGVYQFDFRIPAGTPNGNFGLGCVLGGIGGGGPGIFAKVPVAGG